MAPRVPFWRRVGEFLSRTWQDVTYEGPQPSVSGDPEYAEPRGYTEPPRQRPEPVSPEQAKAGLSTSRADLVQQILDWFPQDGKYERMQNSITGRWEWWYNSPTRGISRGPASPRTVRRNVQKLSQDEIDSLLVASRDEFLALAAGNAELWYHADNIAS